MAHGMTFFRGCTTTRRGSVVVLDRADRRLVDLLERRGAMAAMAAMSPVRSAPISGMSISEIAKDILEYYSHD